MFFDWKMSRFEHLKMVLALIFLSVVMTYNVDAQNQENSVIQTPVPSGLVMNPTGIRVSMLTCGAGEELYSTYGHSAVRIIDSTTGTDKVYNYGTFNYGDPQFYWKFTRGKLPYYVTEDDFAYFMREYIIDKRSVMEQVLAVNTQEAYKIQSFLLNNIKEENKYYKYDFLFDNCSTRIRDLFQTTLGPELRYGRVIANDSVSFRTYLNYYERNLHWERFGINLLMSDLVDEKMTNEQSFFLPDFLMQGVGSAFLHGQPFVKETLQLAPAKQNFTQYVNQPKLILWGLLLLILFISFSKTGKKYLLYFDVFFFMILGLLGCFMLFMWFGTEHKVCAWNRNLLWAFPLHIGFAYLIARKSELIANYARYTNYLVIASMFFGLVAKQEYIAEITPLLILIIMRMSTYTKGLRFTSMGNWKGG